MINFYPIKIPRVWRTKQPGHPQLPHSLLNFHSEISSQSLANLDDHRSGIRLHGRLALDTINLARLTSSNTQSQPKEGNLSNLHTRIIPVVSLNLEGLPVIHELQARRPLLHETDSIIEVQLARCLAVSADRDDELKIVLAERGGGQGTLDALGYDGAAAVVEGNIRGAEVVDDDGLALALDAGVGEEVVEDVLGEVGGDGRGVLVDDGADKDTGAEEVLGLDAECVLVVGVEVEERAD